MGFKHDCERKRGSRSRRSICEARLGLHCGRNSRNVSGDPYIDRQLVATKLIAIDADEIERVWNKIYPLLKGACDFSRGNLDEKLLKATLVGKGAQLWALVSDRLLAALVTRVTDYPFHKSLQIIAGGGELSAVLDCEETLQHHARAHDCKTLEMLGRIGWMKPLRKRGWKTILVGMEKEI